MSAYIVAVRPLPRERGERGGLDHVGPFRSEETAERYAARRRPHVKTATVQPLYRPARP